MAYAVVSSDSIYEMQVLGVRKINTKLQARFNDRFRIGSNTKAITGMLAALLVKQGKLSWSTKFFDIFPEMRTHSRKEYYNYTLLDLLTFRTRFIRYTYTDALPTKDQFKGDEQEQRYQFLQWVLQQSPVQTNGISFSNPNYVAVGLMLERISGKTYNQLVKELGQKLNIDLDIGQPNAKDITQTWGHNTSLTPEAPADNYKLNWLLSAGNINLTLPDYAKFIQLQLSGLQGRSSMLNKEEFEFMHYGAPTAAIGWFWEKDEKGRLVSYSTGNPGTFLAKVYIFKDENKAFIVLSNAQTDEADKGMDILYTELRKKYLKATLSHK
ncbi:MAG: serine hydrolase [Bacteroidetes bacterium]|nr:serine hydrolase [Bacteroidota bacterium]